MHVFFSGVVSVWSQHNKDQTDCCSDACLCESFLMSAEELWLLVLGQQADQGPCCLVTESDTTGSFSLFLVGS